MSSGFNWSEDNLIVSVHAPDVFWVYGLFVGVMYLRCLVLTLSFDYVYGTSRLTPILG